MGKTNPLAIQKLFITTTQAMEVACVSRPTIITWCQRYKIGVLVGGQWRIDPNKLKELLEGLKHARQRKDNTQ